jgi:TolB-like protein
LLGCGAHATIGAVLHRRAFVAGSLLIGGLARAAGGKPTLAILLFDYSGNDQSLEPLREGLAQMLISDFSGVPQVRVVERARLKAILEEQKLGQSGKVDAASAARVGKLLGARFLVLGSYFDLKTALRIDARLVEVETGRILKSVGANGAADDFWTLEQTLAQKLGAALQESLPELAQPARATPPKVKSKTIATYGRALSAIDRGHKAEAKALLNEVVADAPQFSLAKKDLNALLQ